MNDPGPAMDPGHMITEALRLREQAGQARLAEWRLIIGAIADCLGGISDCIRTGTQVRFEAEPLEAAPVTWRDARCRLRHVTAAYHDSGGLAHGHAGGPGLATLSSAWTLLGEAVHELLPLHGHSGFVIDFRGAMIGCWHETMCADCTGGMPCLVVDLTASGPLDLEYEPAVAGVGVLGFPRPADCLGPTDPRICGLRPAPDLVGELLGRMGENKLSFPCTLVPCDLGKDSGEGGCSGLGDGGEPGEGGGPGHATGG